MPIGVSRLSERGEGEFAGMVIVLVLFFTGSSAYRYFTAPPNRTETDKIYLRIPAKMNARSGDGERRFRASRTLIGAKRRRQ